MAFAADNVAQEPSAGLHDKRLVWLLVGCIFASCSVLLEPPLWSFRLPETSPFGQSWVTYNVAASLFTLVTLAFILLSGALGDAYGRRLLYLIGIGGSLAANLLLFLSPDTTWFLIMRTLASIFGALVLPISLTMLLLTFRDRDLSISFAIFVVATVTSGIGSGFLALLLDSVFGWRAAFIAPTAAGIAALVLVLRFTKESRVPENERVGGVTDSMVTLVILSLVYGIVSTRFAPEYIPIVVIVSLSIAVIGSIFLLWWTHTRSELRKMSDFVRWAVLAALFSFGIAIQFAMIAFLGKLHDVFVIVLGYSQIVSLLAYIPFLAGMVAVLVFGWDRKVRLKLPALMCSTMAFMGLLLVATGVFHLGESYLWLGPALFLFGAALLIGSTAWLTVFFRSIPGHLVGVRAGINTAISQLGAAVGMALSSVVIVNQGLADYEQRLISAGVPSEKVDGAMTALTALLDPATPDPAMLPPELANGLLEGYKSSFLAAFEWLLIGVGFFCFLATVLAWFAARQVLKSQEAHEVVIQGEQAQAT